MSALRVTDREMRLIKEELAEREAEPRILADLQCEAME
jgi:hypothetical protein